VRILYHHDPAEPIGAWTVSREDARGLYVEGRLAPGVGRQKLLADEVRRARRVVDRLPDSEGGLDPKTGVRRILEADLWEISVASRCCLRRAYPT
jgi:phage head maturation protease